MKETIDRMLAKEYEYCIGEASDIVHKFFGTPSTWNYDEPRHVEEDKKMKYSAFEIVLNSLIRVYVPKAVREFRNDEWKEKEV
jgi:hypothetical protein